MPSERMTGEFEIVSQQRGPARLILTAVVASVVSTLSLAAPVVRPGVARAAVVNPSIRAVTADALPTVQIDGVVWAQAVVADTVYAGGSFANARPAGSAPRANTVPRMNVLAYSLSTGNLVADFAPDVNAQVRAVAISPDGTRLYIGGSFTEVNGVPRTRIAAFDLASGTLIDTFSPQINSDVRTIVATDTTVYAGGGFSNAGGMRRSHAAAFSTVDGSTLAWDPSADADVDALVVTPDGSRVIAGGAFANMAGAPAYGLAALDPITGALMTWNAVNTIRDAGKHSAILSLTTDGSAVYGTGYVYGSVGGNFEGTFSADPDSGTLNWLEDCHGDSYGAFATSGQLYTVSHAHYCGNIGGFGETTPRTYHRALAFTLKATTTVTADPTQGRYANFAGQPAPSIVNWFPDLLDGKYTGQHQAAWSVTGNSSYVALGGEFPSVNGVPQQGLVRFATRAIAPQLAGPAVTAAELDPSLIPLSASSMMLRWQTAWDPDDTNLTYTVIKDGEDTAPIFTGTIASTFWNRPAKSIMQSGLTPGTTYSYRIFVSDPAGNTVGGDRLLYTAPTVVTPYMAYVKRLMACQPTSYYPLDQATAATPLDVAGFDDGVTTRTAFSASTSAIAGDGATTLKSPGTIIAQTLLITHAPTVYTVQIWFRSTSAQGGAIMGYGLGQGAVTTVHDRQLYLQPDGHVAFVITNDGYVPLVSPTVLNDGLWHQLTATEGSSGSALFVDGAQVASTATRTQDSDNFSGNWRVGAENLAGYPSAPSSAGLVGDVDEEAIYPTALNAGTIRAEYVAAGRHY